mmetsp:Transcript_12830/g.21491  ORF Transcript_12830/g.21491 Transcript_12830/m.21491 type:complete len:314 (+) Transcript_12830:76-1017(+)|eukprot:CAMPEP_0174996242 /NCGR_PEP_ID=MMETSP0005-20121125/282_1 /TAXON_ID=420556 /ORGANISM="Ochromonas sp., Strain CCMP1393" /LENGTH=313 /DNA_ID=CAMNT_0016250621 /DNA_START=57 /DNA_END=998 /DNA_ORIENTATION=-
MSGVLQFNCHGKGRVRLVKVIRGANGVHDVIQFSVQILLEGDTMDSVFTTGNNDKVVATDTCKNTVYCVANENEFNSPEEFGILLCKHFLELYPKIVNRISVQIIKDRWERLESPDSAGRMSAHLHTFKRIGPNRPYAHVQGEKRPNTQLKLNVQSGFRGLDIMKTTQSGFVGFYRDRYTSLPEDTDRLLGTSIDAEWTYPPCAVLRGGIDYNKVAQVVENALIYEFAGPSDKGTYSKSVQQTLYLMAQAALNNTRIITSITLQMPNIHNLSFALDKYGLVNKDHTGKPSIFFPIDEPHGMIKATVARTPSRL